LPDNGTPAVFLRQCKIKTWVADQNIGVLVLHFKVH